MRTSITFRLLGVFGALVAADAALAGDVSKWKCESCPFEKGTSGTVDIGVGNVSDSSAKFGDYTGLDKQGAFAIAGGQARHRDEDGYWGIAEASDLGLDRRAIAA